MGERPLLPRQEARLDGLRFQGSRPEDDHILLAAGFEPTEEADLWRRNGYWFGREAALQIALRELGKFAPIDEPWFRS